MKGRIVRSVFNLPAPTYECVSDDFVVDRLGYEPLSVIVERFVRQGFIPRPSQEADLVITNKTTEKDIDYAFDAPDPVTSMSKVEQYEALETAQRLVEQLRKASKIAKTPDNELLEPAGKDISKPAEKPQEEGKMA